MAWETDCSWAIISTVVAVRLVVLWAPLETILGERRKGDLVMSEVVSTDRYD